MINRTQLKKERQERLIQLVEENPFLRDEDFATKLGASVATIRLDRTELGIDEYRERIRNVAEKGMEKTQDCGGDLLDLNLYHDGISLLETDSSMTFQNSDLVRGQNIYAFAENLALSVIDAKAALVKVANIKYIRPVRSGDKLVAKFELKRVRDNEYIVWVKIKVELKEVFRGKFNLLIMDNE